MQAARLFGQSVHVYGLCVASQRVIEEIKVNKPFDVALHVFGEVPVWNTVKEQRWSVIEIICDTLFY